MLALRVVDVVQGEREREREKGNLQTLSLVSESDRPIMAALDTCRNGSTISVVRHPLFSAVYEMDRLCEQRRYAGVVKVWNVWVLVV